MATPQPAPQPVSLPDDGELLEMIQTLEGQTRAFAALRQPCNCPRGNRRGINPNLMQGLQTLENRVTEIESRDKGCNCPDNNNSDADPDDYPGLRELEDRVTGMERRNQPCNCPRDDPNAVPDPYPGLRALENRVAGLEQEKQPCNCENNLALEPKRARLDHFPVMSLPGEVRNIIWGFCMEGSDTDIYPRRVAANETIRRSTLDNRTYTDRHGTDGSLLRLLRVSRQVYQEVAPIYYDRTFSFPMGTARVSLRHIGLINAYLFLTDRPADSLASITGLRIDLTAYESEADQMFATIEEGDGAQCITGLLQLMGNMESLGRIDLSFSGWPPDMRTEPWDFEVPANARPMNERNTGPREYPWLELLRNLQRMNRVRIRVTASLGDGEATAFGDYDPHMARVVCFIRAVRNSILRQGERLGNTFIHVRTRHGFEHDQDRMRSQWRELVVECDTEYRARTDTHIDHYERPQRDMSDDRVGGPDAYTGSDDGSQDSLLSRKEWLADLGDDIPLVEEARVMEMVDSPQAAGAQGEAQVQDPAHAQSQETAGEDVTMEEEDFDQYVGAAPPDDEAGLDSSDLQGEEMDYEMGSDPSGNNP
ncbi:hypothetical protein VM1G_07443 [Cytospora mali]|uniref:Uncharacterized protein n=1 Tax=Cytospora mali TaxID=578113 RepID=A0A194W6Z6_CYTMA|nr:hypothetical protein VM1G_07443 [Valsa mali]